MKTLLLTLALASLPSNGQGTASQATQQSTEEKIIALRAELSRLVASMLEPPQEITDKYADFLKLPETGVVKLMPRGLHNSLMDSRLEGGAYYSFIRRAHDYGQGNDIQLEARGLLTVGFAVPITDSSPTLAREQSKASSQARMLPGGLRDLPDKHGTTSGAIGTLPVYNASAGKNCPTKAPRPCRAKVWYTSSGQYRWAGATS